MPRTLNGTLASNLSGEIATPAFTLEITLADGTIKRLTTHPFSKTVDGDLFTASGLTLGKIRFGTNQDRASSEAKMAIGGNSPITVAEVQAGALRSASYQIGIFDYSAASPVKTVLLAGSLGRIRWDGSELFIDVDLKGILRRGQKILVWKNTPNCKATFGDNDCRLPVIEDPSVTHITLRQDSTAYLNATDNTGEGQADFIRVNQASSFNDVIFECTTSGTSAGTPPTFDLTVGNTTADGTAVWTTRDGWVREASVLSVVDLQNFTVLVTESRDVDGWFGGFGMGHGLVIFRTGNNAGRQMEVIKWTKTGAFVQLAAPLPYTVQIGDTLDMIPADPKTFETCWDRFNHGEWFVGEPYKGPFDVIDGPV
jgi:hypothetical protein